MKTQVQLGKPIVQESVLPPLKGPFVYGHKTQYQTLVYPDGVRPGVRTLERWPHLKGLRRKRIAEVGCSSGVDGILALVCGAKSYHGWDGDERSLQLGREMASAWGVVPELRKADCETFADWPKADVAFLFSVTQRLSLGALAGFVKGCGARRVYLESHAEGDPSARQLMTGLAEFRWQKVAVYDSNWRGFMKELWKGLK